MSHDQGPGLRDIVEEETKQTTGGGGEGRGVSIK